MSTKKRPKFRSSHSLGHVLSLNGKVSYVMQKSCRKSARMKLDLKLILNSVNRSKFVVETKTMHLYALLNLICVDHKVAMDTLR